MQSKFRSLNVYIDDIHARRVGQDAILVRVSLEMGEDLRREAILKWTSARMGIITIISIVHVQYSIH